MGWKFAFARLSHITSSEWKAAGSDAKPQAPVDPALIASASGTANF
jgi:hypothetical protein